jgi:S1-C subfamily serine protease/tetratricopeptide (TPR) repeat protein
MHIPAMWVDCCSTFTALRKRQDPAAKAAEPAFWFTTPRPVPAYGHLYAVTNKHVIDDGFCVLRLNQKAGGTDKIITQPEEWKNHPDGDDLTGGCHPSPAIRCEHCSEKIPGAPVVRPAQGRRSGVEWLAAGKSNKLELLVQQCAALRNLRPRHALANSRTYAMTIHKRIALVLWIAISPFVRPMPGFAQNNLSPSAVFRNAKPSIVLIIGSDSNGQPTVQGSGFIVAQDRIVTNHHVVAGSSGATAVFSDGATSEVTAVAVDSAANDLTVVMARTGQRPALHLGDELTLQQGDTVYAIGAPEGLELTLTNGIVSAFRNIDNRFLIQTTAVIGHGSSGGPLFDREGKVVGITSAMLSDTPGIYFSIGAGDLKHLLRTPQLVIVSFAEWAKQNADAGTKTPQPAISSPNSSEADHIEKLLQEKKFDQAKAALRTLIVQAPDSEIVHRLSGELNEKVGDVDGALRELGLSVQEEPTDAIGQFYYAIALYQKRKFASALEHELKSNELAPTESDRPLLALLYYSVGKYGQAEDFARKTLTSDPNNDTALSVLAGVAYHGASHQADTWKQYAQRISAIDPDGFWVHMSRGADAYSQSQMPTADVEFTAAEKYDFPDPAPYLFLAYSYERAAEFGKATDHIRAGLASVPDDPQLLAAGVFLSLRGHDDTEARSMFDSLEISYPGTLQTENTGCLYYYGVGQALKALPYCLRSTVMSPNDHTSHSNYGWVALDANQFPLALQEFSQAYKIATTNGKQITKIQDIDLLWGTLIASYSMGDRKQAQKLLQTMRSIYPEAATVTGLQEMPLLWSATSMSRIESILMEVPR